MDAPNRILTSSLVLHGRNRLGWTAPGFQLVERYPHTGMGGAGGTLTHTGLRPPRVPPPPSPPQQLASSCEYTGPLPGRPPLARDAPTPADAWTADYITDADLDVPTDMEEDAYDLLDSAARTGDGTEPEQVLYEHSVGFMAGDFLNFRDSSVACMRPRGTAPCGRSPCRSRSNVDGFIIYSTDK